MRVHHGNCLLRHLVRNPRRSLPLRLELLRPMTHLRPPSTPPSPHPPLRIVCAVAVGIWVLSAQNVFCRMYSYAVESACVGVTRRLDYLPDVGASFPTDATFPSAVGAFPDGTPDGRALFESARALSETCSPNCPDMYKSDGMCDGVCQSAACEWDGGDVREKQP